MLNKSNKGLDKKLGFSSSTWEKVYKLLEEQCPGKLKIDEDKKTIKESVIDLLEKDEKVFRNLAFMLVSETSADFFYKFDFLHLDKKFVSLALSRDSSIYYALSKNLKADPEIGKVAIESMIREQKNYLEIEKFIDNFFPKNKKKLYKHYNQKLKQANTYNKKDLTLTLLSIRENNPEFYEQLVGLDLIKGNGNKLKINPEFIADILSQLSDIKDYSTMSDEQKLVVKISLLENIFHIDFQKTEGDEEYLLESILSSIYIEESKNQLKQKDIKEEKADTTIEVDEKKEETKSDIGEDDFESFGTYCYPECEIYKSGSNYSVETISGKSIKIPESEANNFTTNAFKNFIGFYNTLYSLGLNFLWDKYSHDFKLLCNNKVGFNYLNGDGITEGKTLQILNIVGKNIGIPEEEIIDENGKKTGRYKCFKDLQSAKSMYGSIKATGYIGDTKYSDNSAFGNSAVENKLIVDGLIDTKKGILNLSEWK